MKDDRQFRMNSGARHGARPLPTRSASAPDLSDAERGRLEERLLFIAQRRYRFREDIARDLAQRVLATYAEARSRYPEDADRFTILVGLLRSNCREHIRRQICLTAQGNAIRDVMPGAAVPTALAAGVLDDIASRDVRKLILEALLELRPRAREALHSLRDGATRLDLLEVIERLGLGPQADAASLGAYRTQFREVLARSGIQL